MRRATVEHYARRVERLWLGSVGTTQVLSRKDWELVLDWHERGIPLRIIEEAIEAAFERRGKGSAPRGLSYLAPAVEQSWQVIIEGRLEGGGATPVNESRLDSVLDRWRSRRDAEADGSLLASLLDDLLARAERGESPEILDRCLDQALPVVAPEELRRSCRKEVDSRLAPFASRMEDPTLEATRLRAWVDLLRRGLDLPSLRGAAGQE